MAGSVGQAGLGRLGWAGMDSDDAELGQSGTVVSSTEREDSGELPLPDRAYALHLCGHSLRAIAARLHIDKDTAHAYVKQVARELAPRHRAKREQLRREAVDRFHAISAQASDAYEAGGDPKLLGVLAKCAAEIAKLEGLYIERQELKHTGRIEQKLTIAFVNDWRDVGKAKRAGTLKAGQGRDARPAVGVAGSESEGEDVNA